jgi:hypothetical protein
LAPVLIARAKFHREAGFIAAIDHLYTILLNCGVLQKPGKNQPPATERPVNWDFLRVWEVNGVYRGMDLRDLAYIEFFMYEPRPPSVYSRAPELSELALAELAREVERLVATPIEEEKSVSKEQRVVMYTDKVPPLEELGWHTGTPRVLVYSRVGGEIERQGAAIIWRNSDLSAAQLPGDAVLRAEAKEVYCTWDEFVEHVRCSHRSLPVNEDITWPFENSQADGKRLLRFSDTLRFARAHCKGERLQAFEDALCVPGAFPGISNMAMSGMLLAQVGAVDIVGVLNHYGLVRSPMLTLAKCLKLVHNFVRLTGLHPVTAVALRPDERRAYYGLDYCLGRSVRWPLDFRAEMLTRATPSSRRAFPIYQAGVLRWDEAEYSSVFARVVEDTLREACRDHVRLVSVDALLDERMIWVSSGSAPGVKLETVHETLGANKRAAYLHIRREGLLEVLDNVGDAVLHSRHATKYEPGKNRALWNTGLGHYGISSLLLEQWSRNERANVPWNVSSHKTEFAWRCDIDRCRRVGEEVAVMWDFSDFNINHMLVHMAYLYVRAAYVLASRADMTSVVKSRIIDCAEWLATSTMDTVLEDVQSGLILQVARSMMTGIRGTSFVNTMLNRVYTKMAQVYTERYTLARPLRDPTYAMGDDVYSSALTRFDGVTFCLVMNTLGTAGTLSKINLELGELLRVSYTAEGCSGYPVRALVGLVSGEYFESRAINDIHERCAAFHEQMSRCIARGARIPVKPMWDMLSRLHCRLTYRVGRRRRHLYPRLDLLYTPPAFGGLGLIDTESMPGVVPREVFNNYKRPTWALSRGFVRSLRNAEVSDARNLRLLGYADDARVRGMALNEIAESAVVGKAPRSEVAHAYNKYIAEFREWYGDIRYGARLDDLAPQVNVNLGLVASLLRRAAMGQSIDHHYGVIAGLAAALGFASSAAFKVVLRETLPGADVLVQLRHVVSVLRPHMLEQVSAMVNTLYGFGVALRRNWAYGDLGLMPVPTTHHSKTNSIIRSIALHIVELTPSVLSKLDNRGIVLYMHALELRVREFVLLNLRAIGLDLKD